VNDTKIILFYNTMWDQPLAYPEADIPDGYVLTTERQFMPEAVAVVFHLPSLRLNRLPKKRKGQLWVAWSMECCEAHYPGVCDPLFARHFDLRMDYHLNADVVVSYVEYSFMEALRGPVQEKQPGKMINAFISSSFNQSGRAEYLRELMKCLDVHSYGTLLQNRVIQDDTGRQSRLDTMATYRFTLACENAIAQDYVSEKFYDPLIAGSVPVYLGAPNIEEFAPGDKCFIDASEFSGPKALAEYLLVTSKDDGLYQSYHEWRTKPFRSAFVKLLEQKKEHPFVRLCRKVQDRL